MTNCYNNSARSGGNSKRGSLSPAPRSRSRSVRRRGRSMIRKEHREDRQLTPAPFKFGTTASSTSNGTTTTTSTAASASAAEGRLATHRRRGTTHSTSTTAHHHHAIVRARSVEDESSLAGELMGLSAHNCQVYLTVQEEYDGEADGGPISTITTTTLPRRQL